MSAYLATVQMDCSDNIIDNTNTVIRLLKSIKEKEPDTALAVFPEMCIYGYDNLDKLKINFSQNDFDKCFVKISDVCKEIKLEAFIGAPYFENNKIFNSLYFFNTNGDFKKVYSKKHLIDAEINYFSPGNEYGICHTSLGKAGLLICWDSAYPEEAKHYSDKNVDFIIVSAAWELPYTRQWKLSTATRSFDNHIPLAASNRIGTDSNCTYFGNSAIYDNIGNTVSAATDMSECFVTAEFKSLFSDDKNMIKN